MGRKGDVEICLTEHQIQWAYKWFNYGASYEQLGAALYVDPKTVYRAFKRRGLYRIRTPLVYNGKD